MTSPETELTSTTTLVTKLPFTSYAKNENSYITNSEREEIFISTPETTSTTSLNKEVPSTSISENETTSRISIETHITPMTTRGQEISSTSISTKEMTSTTTPETDTPSTNTFVKEVYFTTIPEKDAPPTTTFEKEVLFTNIPETERPSTTTPADEVPFSSASKTETLYTTSLDKELPFTTTLATAVTLSTSFDRNVSVRSTLETETSTPTLKKYVHYTTAPKTETSTIAAETEMTSAATFETEASSSFTTTNKEEVHYTTTTEIKTAFTTTPEKGISFTSTPETKMTSTTLEIYLPFTTATEQALSTPSPEQKVSFPATNESRTSTVRSKRYVTRMKIQKEFDPLDRILTKDACETMFKELLTNENIEYETISTISIKAGSTIVILEIKLKEEQGNLEMFEVIDEAFRDNSVEIPIDEESYIVEEAELYSSVEDAEAGTGAIGFESSASSKDKDTQTARPLPTNSNVTDVTSEMSTYSNSSVPRPHVDNKGHDLGLALAIGIPLFIAVTCFAALLTYCNVYGLRVQKDLEQQDVEGGRSKNLSKLLVDGLPLRGTYSSYTGPTTDRSSDEPSRPSSRNSERSVHFQPISTDSSQGDKGSIHGDKGGSHGDKVGSQGDSLVDIRPSSRASSGTSTLVGSQGSDYDGQTSQPESDRNSWHYSTDLDSDKLFKIQRPKVNVEPKLDIGPKPLFVTTLNVNQSTA